MFLKKIFVKGFKGINELNADFSLSSALIGENGWGKSSFLRLFRKVFSSSGKIAFSREDFNSACSCADPKDGTRGIQIEFQFCEQFFGEVAKSAALQKFNKYWQRGTDDLLYIHLRITSCLDGDKAVSDCGFVSGGAYDTGDSDLFYSFVHLVPVLVIKDNRMSELPSAEVQTKAGEKWRKDLIRLSERLLVEDEGRLSKKEADDALSAIDYIMTSFFGELKLSRRYKYRSYRDIASKPVSLGDFSSLRKYVNDASSKSWRIVLTIIAGMVLKTKSHINFSHEVYPILLIEDPESRLYPNFLILFMSIILKLPTQKILTTNSSDVLTCMNLSEIKRISHDGRGLKSSSINEINFSSDEIRRLSYHVRMTRPSSFFARVWLLVEGETEIWLILKLSEILGFSLIGEGIRLIDFAQCGITPLVKAADQLRLGWFVLADGDEAGRHYQSKVIDLIGDSGRADEHITVLPSLDIEHFLYKNGFEQVFRRESGIGTSQNYSENKIIELAIHHKSKPGLALSVVEFAERNGGKTIPELFQNIFYRLVSMAKTRG